MGTVNPARIFLAALRGPGVTATDRYRARRGGGAHPAGR